MKRKKTIVKPTVMPVRGLRGTTRPGVGEVGLNLEGQRLSNNFVDAGPAPNPSRTRRVVNIETRPRPFPRARPGATIGAEVGRRTRTSRVRTTP